MLVKISLTLVFLAVMVLVGVYSRRHADSVDGFVLDAEQFDDLTMLCLEYKGPVGGEPEKT